MQSIHNGFRVWLAFASLLMCAGGVSAATDGQQGVWPTTAVTAPPQHKPRILLIHDMEGLAGQDDPYTFLYGHPNYPRGRQLLVDDVNAVVDGLFRGGAASVTVADGHGSGNPQPDLPVERLDPRAKLISRASWFDAYLDLAEGGEFDAVVVVGMHAKSGSKGFASHTYTIGMELMIQGRSITETELVAMLYGRTGMPVIFASGDDRLAADLKTMPWLRYVTTKQATSASSARLLPVAAVHREMRDEAKAAVENWRKARVISFTGPIRVAVRAVPPANMKWLEGMPGVQYANETVTFSAHNVVAAYRGVGPIVAALAFSFSDAENTAFERLPDAAALQHQGMVELYRRWFAAESSLAPPPAPAAKRSDEQYHGFH